ncbi:MAG TPA: glycoside hydrolase family 25 protein [Candidatus Paceibacterota bacterium]
MTFNPNLIVPDISFYQDNNNTVARPDFMKMKAAGAVAVILRVGQNTWIDEDFVYNYNAAKEAGLLRGVYWFYDSRSKPSDQAALLLGVVGQDLPELGYWLDLEENYGGTYKGWQNWKTCLTLLKSSRSKVGIYTAPSYWVTNRPPQNELPFFGAFPLWIANYGVSAPTIPVPWTLDTCWFWQYTSAGDGTKYGVESLEIDLSRFNGTAEDFNRLFGGTVNPPPDNTGGSNMQYKVVWSAGVARRSAPTTTGSSTTLTPYAYNDVVEVIQDNIPDQTYPADPNKKWVKFADGMFGASDYPDSLGVAQKRMVNVTVTPPPPASSKSFTFKADGFKEFTGTLEPE